MENLDISEVMLQICLSHDVNEVISLSNKWEEEVKIDDLDYRGMRLSPYFYATLKKFNIKSKYEKHLKVLHQFWWIKTNFLQDQLQISCGELAKNGINPVILKGGSLLNYYQEPVLRPMGDIDIMVSFSEILPSIKVLESLGYSILPEVLPMLKKSPKMHSDFGHSVNLYNKKLGVEIDLHWRLGHYLSEGITKAMFGNKENHPTINKVYVPNLSYEVIITILHAVLSKSLDNLNWYLDIMILNKNMTYEMWDEVFDIAIKEEKLDLLLSGIEELKKFNIQLNIKPHNFRNKKIKLCTYDEEVASKEKIFIKAKRKVLNNWISVSLIFPNTTKVSRACDFIRYSWFQFIFRKDLREIKEKLITLR